MDEKKSQQQELLPTETNEPAERKPKKSGKVVFKAYNQAQMQLLPQAFDEFVDQNHAVRAVDRMIEAVPLEKLERIYAGGGTSSYHPKMLLKVLVYAYSDGIRSSRRIAKSLRENIIYMWLSGGNKPDFRTINRFRIKIKDSIEEIFRATVELLIEGGHVSLNNYFLDGTKIESAANKYSFTWKKTVEYNKEKLKNKVRELFKQIDAENEIEDELYGDRDLPERGEESGITPEMIEKKIAELNERLKDKPDDKDLNKTRKTLATDYQPRLERYQRDEAILGTRNSYSKTDHDATFMRMKEDAMLNGQLKPGYNVQIGTENQFILNFSIHQKPGDSTTLIPHLENFEQLYGFLPEKVVADAGYGSEENYIWLDKHGSQAFVKYNMFDIEKKQKYRKNIFRVENLSYDPETDVYRCPNEKLFHFSGKKKRQTETGFVSEALVYECEDCTGCPFKEQCYRGKWNRRIDINPRLVTYRAIAKERLNSDEGIKLRIRRSTEVESVFGHIKQCRGLRRFLLRGIDKVKAEWGLASMAHNALKLAKCTS